MFFPGGKYVVGNFQSREKEKVVEWDIPSPQADSFIRFRSTQVPTHTGAQYVLNGSPKKRF